MGLLGRTELYKQAVLANNEHSATVGRANIGGHGVLVVTVPHLKQKTGHLPVENAAEDIPLWHLVCVTLNVYSNSEILSWLT